MMKKIIIIIIALLIYIPNVMGQVEDVNKNIKKEKESSGEVKSSDATNSGSTSSAGDAFLGFVVNVFVATIGSAQKAALENVRIYPERVSLETFTSYGTEVNNSTNYFHVGLRLNWGIIGSDFKYTNLNDMTGRLKTIDWQVVVIRIPIKNFKIDYGLGFISILDLDQSYSNSSLGFDWRLPNIGVNITSAYQWSGKTSLDSRYKKSFILRADYNIYSFKKVHFSPMLEYAYHTYFEQTNFSLISAGIIIRVF